MRLHSKTKTLLATVTLALVSACITVYSYALIRQAEEQKIVLLSKLKVGENNYQLIADEKCFGILSVSLSTEDASNTEVNAKLDFGLRMNGKSRRSTNTLSAQFNPLGQLALSRLNISSPGISGTASSEGVRPIELRYTMRVGEKDLSDTFSISGPIEIEKIKDHYQISMPTRKSSGTQFTTEAISGLLPEFQVAPQSSIDPSCTSNETGLDLQRLQLKLLSVMGTK